MRSRSAQRTRSEERAACRFGPLPGDPRHLRSEQRGDGESDLGKEPFFERVYAYLAAVDEQGALRVPNPAIAATQSLGMVSNVVFWPKLLLAEWDPAPEQIDEAVTGAATMLTTTYRAEAG